jgi:hypothetical protein
LTPPCFAKLLIADYGFDFFDSVRNGDQDAVLRFDVENQVVENQVVEITYYRKYEL